MPLWRLSASSVAFGTRSRSTNSTGSPERAAQAAAGIANAGSSEEASTMFARLGCR